MTLLFLPLPLPQASACAAQKHKALHLAIRLLPWLVSGAMAVILAQVMKADFAKEWAAWLQAIIIVGVSFGGPLNIALCLEKVLPIPFMPNVHPCVVSPQATVSAWLLLRCYPQIYLIDGIPEMVCAFSAAAEGQPDRGVWTDCYKESAR